MLHLSGGKELRMPFDVLEPYEELTRKRKHDGSAIFGSSSEQAFDLTDIHFATGHIIVYFLMTGTYQCLRSRDPQEEWRRAKEFRAAICVYIAAVDKKLPGLRDLARQQIAKLGEQISLLTVIKIIEGYKPVSESIFGTFYPGTTGYLQFKIQSFARDATEAEAKDMLAQLETPRTLSEFLLKNMILMKLPTQPKAEEKTDQKMDGAPATKNSVQLAEEAILEAEGAHQKAIEQSDR